MGDSIPPGVKPTAIGLGSGAGVLGALIWAFTQILGSAQADIGSKIDGVAGELREIRKELAENNKQSTANALRIEALAQAQDKAERQADKERSELKAAVKALDDRVDGVERRARARDRE